MKAKRKRPVAEVMPNTPDLDYTCGQLEDLYNKVMSGKVSLDKARVGLGVKKQQMRRFDYAIQIARLNPNERPKLSQLLGWTARGGAAPEQATIQGQPEPKPAIAG